MLALQRVEDETDPETGLPFSVVTDPENQFNFVTSGPVVNWAAKTKHDDQETYYKALEPADKNAARPSRAGHLWRVKLRDKT